MNISVTFYLQQQARRFESKCDSLRLRLPLAKTMGEVKRLSDVTLKSELRGMPGVREAQAHLDRAAESCMEKLLEVQLAKLDTCTCSDELKAERGRLISREWNFLRGDFSSVYRKAERESARMLHLLKRRESDRAPDDDAPSDPMDAP